MSSKLSSGFPQGGHNLYLPMGLCNRTYKFVTSPNGMIALLISDPTQDISSVAFSVCSGAYNDPKELPGLAHFCEHMLMLQSRKYPEINKLQKLIVGSNSGMMNAYTTGELTSFYYQLKCPNNDFAPLEESLDIFSSLLKEPLFSPEYIKREIIAIDNEHTRNKSSLTKILFHGLRLLSSFDNSNVFNRFATGNFQTLSKCNPKLLRQKLVEYYEKNFVPEKFVFVIKSPQSTNILQKIFLLKFSWLNDSGSILNSDLQTSDITQSKKIFDYSMFSSPPFTKQQQNKCLFIKSNSNMSLNNLNLIRVIFPLRYNMNKIEESRETLIFTNYLTNFLGSDTKNSIFRKLCPSTGSLNISKCLIDSLDCFVSEIKEGDFCLILELYPTKYGIKRLNEIILCIFQTISENFIIYNQNSAQYIALLTRIAKELSEFFIVSNINYLYTDSDESPMDEVCDYAAILQQNLKIIGDKWLLSGMPSISDLQNFAGYFNDDPSWWFSIAEKLKQFVIRNLNYDNFNLILFGDESLLYNGYNKVQSASSLFFEDDYYHKVANNVAIKESDFSYFVEPHFSFEYNYYNINLNPILSLSPKVNFRNSTKISKEKIDKLDFLNPHFENIFIPTFAKDYKFMNSKYIECQNISKTASLGFSNTKSSTVDGIPKLIDKSDNYQIWLKEESQMKYQGKCVISFDFLNQNIKLTIHKTLCNEILNELLTAKLHDELKACEILGYNWNITTSSKNDIRIGFLVGGYLEKIPLILKIIKKMFSSMRKNYVEFISDELYHKCWLKIKGLYNDLETGKNSLEKATAGSLVVLEENNYLLEERLEELQEITYEDVQYLFEKLFGYSRIYSNIFIQGNISKSFIYHILSSIAKISNDLLDFDVISHFQEKPCSPSVKSFSSHMSNYQKIMNNKVKYPTTHMIPAGKNYYIEEKSDDLSSGILYFIQCGIMDDIYTRTMTHLISYFISMNAMSELRTNKQLGYAVFSGVRIYKATLGVHISVASGLYRPNILESEINLFLLKLESLILKMSEKEFNEIIKYSFLKMYIYVKKSDPEYIKEFFSKLNEENIEYYMNSSILNNTNSDLGSNSRDELEDLSSVSALKTGSSLDNLNTQQIKMHNRIWNELISQTYRFSNIRTNYATCNLCDESFASLDLLIVNGLTKADFLRFWQSRISVKSSTISKLSVFITSEDNYKNNGEDSDTNYYVVSDIGNKKARIIENEDKQEKFYDNEQIEMISSQIEIILRVNNLLIPHEKIIEIVARSRCNQGLIMKDLMQYFSKNGEKFKVYAMVLRSIIKTINKSIKMMVSKKNQVKLDGICEREVKLEKIKSISDFKRSCLPV